MKAFIRDKEKRDYDKKLANILSEYLNTIGRITVCDEILVWLFGKWLDKNKSINEQAEKIYYNGKYEDITESVMNQFSEYLERFDF